MCVCAHVHVLEHLQPLSAQEDQPSSGPKGVPCGTASRGMRMQVWVTQGRDADLVAWPPLASFPWPLLS